MLSISRAMSGGAGRRVFVQDDYYLRDAELDHNLVVRRGDRLRA
jgi:hypothetical protein